jgi:hypothetical protein
VADHIYRYRDVLGAGVSRRQFRTFVDNGDAISASRGIYASGPGERLRDVRALIARLPRGTVLGFRTAATLLGLGPVLGPCPPAGEGVHVIVPPGVARPRIRGVVCHEAAVPVRYAVMIGGVPCAPPERCAIDLVRTLPRMHGIALLDGALRAEVCATADLTAELGHHAGLRGVVRARELVGIADGRAECAQESHLRLIVIDGGLPAPEPQVRVCDPVGWLRYRLDLGYPERKVGLEYDGRSHLTTSQLNTDRARMNWLSGQGWAMRYFTAKDIYRSPAAVVATVRAALSIR